MHKYRRVVPLILALIVPLAPAVGCANSSNLEAFYAQKLSWGTCAPFTVLQRDKQMFASPRLDCAYLQVPLDYKHVDGPGARIAVMRQKASVPNQRIGSLVINPGGPGGSGTEAAAFLAMRLGDSPVTQRFDLIGFDPRGVAASKPAIHCYTGPEHDAARLDVEVDTSPAGVARLEDKEKDLVRKCSERSGGDQVLANMGTRDAAKDIDILRAALGDARLTYLGYSYGTDLGTAYAETFPRNVRAMVLDGALDPNQSLTDLVILRVNAIQHAFDAFARWCARQADCPLGTDPAKATDAYHTLVWPVIDRPLPLPDGRKLSYYDAFTGTYAALYDSATWATLKLALQRLAHGQGETLMTLADQLLEGRQPDGSYAGLLDISSAIACMDHEAIKDPRQALDLSKQVLAAAPVLDSGHGPSPALDTCAFWPTPNTRSPHVPRISGLPEVVVVSTTGDPVTPYQQGVNLAKDLNARLLTVEGTQHTAALQGTPCVDDIIIRYLTDLTLPPEGARCTIATPH